MAVMQQGFNQQTPAIMQLLRSANGARRAAPASRKRRKKSASSARKRASSSTRRTKKKRAAGPARLVKGSAAAKRYMAKIRKMRK